MITLGVIGFTVWGISTIAIVAAIIFTWYMSNSTNYKSNLTKLTWIRRKKKMATVAFIGISAAIITIGIRGMIWIWNPDA